MKKTNKVQWAIFFDGTNTTVTKNIAECDSLKGVLVPISAEVAAEALALILEKKGDN